MESASIEVHQPVSPQDPTTPEHAPIVSPNAHRGVRRVHTLPPRLSSSNGNPSSGASAASDVDTLFIHPSAKVVTFTIPAGNIRPGSSSGKIGATGGSVEGTLPWTIPAERPLAVGPLQIYRVSSSDICFLNSGTSLLRPLFQRSQCWLVDEQSKFVLRMGRDLYYRLELPFATDEDKRLVEEFKSVLGTVLLYEKTPSPFRRGYIPEELEPPKTPGKKSLRPQEKAKKWRLEKRWEPADPDQRAKWSQESKEAEGPSTWRKHLRSRSAMVENVARGDSQGTTEDEDSMTDSSSAPSTKQSEDDPAGKIQVELEDKDTTPELPRTFTLPFRPRPNSMRSITAPPQLNLNTLPGAAMRSSSRVSSRDSDSVSIASSHDTFYSVEDAGIASEATDLGDSELTATMKHPQSNHTRQISEITITPSTPTPMTARTVLSEDSRELSNPSTPTLISDSDDENNLTFSDAVTPPDTIRLRKINASTNSQALQTTKSSHTHTLSQPQSRRRQISVALVQKAYALLIGPPSHIVQIMLGMAARIVRSMQGAGGRMQSVPGAWGSSAVYEEEDEWDEDDFGIPLDNLRRDSKVGLKTPSRANSVASSDYDALIEGPIMRSGGSSSSLD